MHKNVTKTLVNSKSLLLAFVLPGKFFLSYSWLERILRNVLLGISVAAIKDVRILKFLSLHQLANFDQRFAASLRLKQERNIRSASVCVRIE